MVAKAMGERITNTDIIMELRVSVANILNAQTYMSEKLEALSTTINGNGNGKPGMAKTLDRVDRDLCNHLAEEDARKKEEKEEAKLKKQQRYDVSWKIVLAIGAPVIVNIILNIITILK